MWQIFGLQKILVGIVALDLILCADVVEIHFTLRQDDSLHNHLPVLHHPLVLHQFHLCAGHHQSSAAEECKAVGRHDKKSKGKYPRTPDSCF